MTPSQKTQLIKLYTEFTKKLNIAIKQKYSMEKINFYEKKILLIQNQLKNY